MSWNTNYGTLWGCATLKYLIRWIPNRKHKTSLMFSTVVLFSGEQRTKCQVHKLQVSLPTATWFGFHTSELPSVYHSTQAKPVYSMVCQWISIQLLYSRPSASTMHFSQILDLSSPQESRCPYMHLEVFQWNLMCLLKILIIQSISAKSLQQWLL